MVVTTGATGAVFSTISPTPAIVLSRPATIWRRATIVATR